MSSIKQDVCIVFQAFRLSIYKTYVSCPYVTYVWYAYLVANFFGIYVSVVNLKNNKLLYDSENVSYLLEKIVTVNNVLHLGTNV